MTDDEASFTVAEMSAETGVPAHTLRYYERAGLIRPVARNAGNQRCYSSADVAWVQFLLRLRQTGMPIARMRDYADLRERGPETTEARLRLLEQHRADLRAQIAMLDEHEQALATKIAIYQHDLSHLRSHRQKRTDDE